MDLITLYHKVNLPLKLFNFRKLYMCRYEVNYYISNDKLRVISNFI